MLKTKRRTKRFAFLLVISMIATMFAGLGTASASSSYGVLASVPAVGSGLNNLATITGEISAGALEDGNVLTVKLPADFVLPTNFVADGADFSRNGIVNGGTKPGSNDTYVYIPATYDGNFNALYNDTVFATGAAAAAGKQAANYELQVVRVNDNTLNLSFKNGVSPMPDEKAYFQIVLGGVTVPSGTNEDINATLSSNNGWGSGTVVVGRGNSESISIAIDKVNTFAEKTTVTIIVTENMKGALVANAGGSTNNFAKLRLPAGFEWGSPGAPAVHWGSLTGGAGGNIVVEQDTDKRYLLISTAMLSTDRTEFEFDVEVTAAEPGTARYGDVNATISTSGKMKVSNSGSLLLGVYGDFGIEMKAESVPEIYSGQIEQKIGNIVLEEKSPGTLIAGRTVIFTLPANAKWAVIDSSPDETRVETRFTGFLSSDGRSIRYEIDNESSTNSGKLIFEDQEIVVAPGTTGDIKVEVSGSAGAKGEVVVAKVLDPIIVTSAAKDVKLGVQGQAGSDIVVKEAAAGILYGKEDLKIKVQSGVKFTSVPNVAVTEGDLVIDTGNITVNEDVLTIPIKTDSVTASTITISDVKYTVDRTFPEGKAYARFYGDALLAVNANNDRLISYLKGVEGSDAGAAATSGDIMSNPYRARENGIFYSNEYAVQVDVANCITPAPSDQTGVTKFVIGQTSYTYNDSTMTMDVAPYIKNDRTYMPIRFVAYAVGISDANIIWSETEQTVTLVRDNIVVQVKVGSTELKVNGAIVNMDVAPEILNSRTMLPASWIAQAFGATVDWDPNTQTVTITK